MAHSKIRKLFFTLLFILEFPLFCEDAVNVSAKMKKITSSNFVFDIEIVNSSDRTLYFYPEGVFGRFEIEDDTLLIVLNNDATYGTHFVSAHEPYWNESLCLELVPGKKTKYRYKGMVSPEQKNDKKSAIKKKKMKTGVSKADISGTKKAMYSLCIIDKPISEIRTFDEYIQCMKSNLLGDKWFVLYDKADDEKK